MILKEILDDFIPHDDDSEYYPKGVSESTVVSVIILYKNHHYLYKNMLAGMLGWQIKSNTHPWLNDEAPITHYKIEK